jgi:hypothetical protein
LHRRRLIQPGFVKKTCDWVPAAINAAAIAICVYSSDSLFVSAS